MYHAPRGYQEDRGYRWYIGLTVAHFRWRRDPDMLSIGPNMQVYFLLVVPVMGMAATCVIVGNRAIREIRRKDDERRRRVLENFRMALRD
jgi:hypothetical protein